MQLEYLLTSAVAASASALPADEHAPVHEALDVAAPGLELLPHRHAHHAARRAPLLEGHGAQHGVAEHPVRVVVPEREKELYLDGGPRWM